MSQTPFEPSSLDLDTILAASGDRPLTPEEIAALRWGVYGDDLTGVGGRRLFLKDLHRGMKAAQEGSDMSLVILDIDNFKTINDTGYNGHQVGDLVLHGVVQSVASGVNGGSTIYRFGGEELAIITPYGDEHMVVDRVAEPARAAAAAYFAHYQRLLERGARTTEEERVLRTYESVFRNDPRALPAITVSAGVASSRTYRTEDEIFRAADQAMYQAKRAGKDRTNVYDPERPVDTQRWNLATLRSDVTG